MRCQTKRNLDGMQALPSSAVGDWEFRSYAIYLSRPGSSVSALRPCIDQAAPPQSDGPGAGADSVSGCAPDEGIKSQAETMTRADDADVTAPQ